MRNKIGKAEIIDNQPYCRCGALVGNLVDYNGAIVGDNTYTRFVRRCSDKDCNNVSIYYADNRLDYTIRKVFDESDVIILREK